MMRLILTRGRQDDSGMRNTSVMQVTKGSWSCRRYLDGSGFIKKIKTRVVGDSATQLLHDDKLKKERRESQTSQEVYSRVVCLTLCCWGVCSCRYNFQLKNERKIAFSSRVEGKMLVLQLLYNRVAADRLLSCIFLPVLSHYFFFHWQEAAEKKNCKRNSKRNCKSNKWKSHFWRHTQERQKTTVDWSHCLPAWECSSDCIRIPKKTFSFE